VPRTAICERLEDVIRPSAGRMAHDEVQRAELQDDDVRISG